MQQLERLVRRIANRLGIDIHRHRPERAVMARLAAMLGVHDVDVVLDVGANTGQFAQTLREAGYVKRLVSFEPLSSAHSELLRKSRSDAAWEIAPRCALGDYDGEVQLHVAGNLVSSSALPMLEIHRDSAPESAVVGTERVPLMRLDSVVGTYVGAHDVPFLKIDVQGFEDRVLDGAVDFFKRAAGMQLELSFIPLYDGQQLFQALVDRLRELGFSIWAIWPGLHDPRSGRMLQVDVVFFRS